MPRVDPHRGEIWMFDCGMAEKVRPVLVLSVTPGPDDRVLVTVVPHTTSLRGSEYEVAVQVRFLKPGAFLMQGVTTYPTVRAERFLGTLSAHGSRRPEVGGHLELSFFLAGKRHRKITLSVLTGECRPSSVGRAALS